MLQDTELLHTQTLAASRVFQLWQLSLTPTTWWWQRNDGISGVDVLLNNISLEQLLSMIKKIVEYDTKMRDVKVLD